MRCRSWTSRSVAAVLRNVRQSLGLIGIAAVVAPLLFAVGSVPVIGQTLVPVTSAAFGGWMLGIELLGSPFERRGLLRLSERRAAMRRHRFRVLGFAIPAFCFWPSPSPAWWSSRRPRRAGRCWPGSCSASGPECSQRTDSAMARARPRLTLPSSRSVTSD